VMTTTPDGSLNAVDATVAAVLEYPIKEIDDRLLYLPYESAARLLKAEGKATNVALLLDDGADLERTADAVRAALKSAGRPVIVKTWVETAAFYKQVRLLYIAIFLFTGLVLSTVVVLATANTMTMSV